MLYILGGASRSGKSIIARRFVEEKRIPYFCIDALITILQNGIPQLGIKHGQPFISKAENLWMTVKPLLVHLIKDEPDYLIEGDGILPKHIAKLRENHDDKIKACFVGYASINPQKKLEDVRKFNNYKDDWTKEIPHSEMLENIKDMIEYSKYLRTECSKYRIQYFDVSENFEKTLDEIFNYLD